MNSYCPPPIQDSTPFSYGGLYRGKWLEDRRTRDPVEPKSFIKPGRERDFNIASARAQHDGSGKTLYSRHVIETLCQDALTALPRIKTDPTATRDTDYLAIEKLIDNALRLYMNAVVTQDASFTVLIDYLRRGQIHAYGERRPVTIKKFIDNACIPFYEFAKSYIDAKIDTQIPDHIQFQLDQRLTRLILANLLANAINAASENKEQVPKIGLQVELATPANKPRELHFTITNPGKIAEDKLKQLGVENISEQGKGHGIGLVSVGDMVRAHGGKLGARNYQENGQNMVEVSFYIQEMKGDKLLYPPTGA